MSVGFMNVRSFNKLLLISLLLALGIIGSSITIFDGKASALSGSDFKAGRIIDDAVFYNKSSMTPQQIQNFLNSKVPSCDTNGQKIYSGSTTRAQYGASRGYPAPYTCLKDYSQNVPSIVNGGSDLCKGSISGGVKSAASIIYDAAQACGINPQVLIVLLQKEQSLITDDWPWSIQYRSATGYGCPDTAPCDSEYYGFFNQVYQAAKAFRRYEANPTLFNYRAGRNNYIQYNPNSACGGSNVFIENQATANLYIYTPYQPNQSALNNLYGSGDSCGAYGNRNFWRIFNDWFGSTAGTESYSWNIVTQKAFTDSSKNTEIANYKPSLNFKQRAFLQLKVRNNGNLVWYKNSIRIGTSNSQNRNSAFCDTTWISCARPSTITEDVVRPGEIATFEFWVKAPEGSGLFQEYFNILWEDRTWFPSQGLYYPIEVKTVPFYGVLTSNKIFGSNDYKDETDINSLNNNRKYFVVYKIKNIGTETWSKTGSNAVSLGNLNNAISGLCDSSWVACNRPTKLKEESVRPGQTGTFEFWVRTGFSSNGFLYPEKFRLLIENVRWFDYPQIDSAFKINTPDSTWGLLSQTSYTDSSESVLSPTNNLKINEGRYVVIKARNLSGKTWNNFGQGQIRLATSSPLNSSSLVCHETWIACNRPSSSLEESVKPGEIATFKFWIRAKEANLNYNERYRLVSENNYWLGDAGLLYHYQVK